MFSSQSLDTGTKKGPLVQINPESHLVFLWETVFLNYVILCFICIFSTLTSQARGENALQGSPTFLAPGACLKVIFPQMGSGDAFRMIQLQQWGAAVNTDEVSPT